MIFCSKHKEPDTGYDILVPGKLKRKKRFCFFRPKEENEDTGYDIILPSASEQHD